MFCVDFGLCNSVYEKYKRFPPQSICAVMCVVVCVGRIAVFSITVLHDERIVVVAEQRPDSTEEESFQWMSRVLQVPLSHSVVIMYSIIL